MTLMCFAVSCRRWNLTMPSSWEREVIEGWDTQVSAAWFRSSPTSPDSPGGRVVATMPEPTAADRSAPPTVQSNDVACRRAVGERPGRPAGLKWGSMAGKTGSLRSWGAGAIAQLLNLIPRRPLCVDAERSALARCNLHTHPERHPWIPLQQRSRLKNPSDLALYTMLIGQLRPTTIVRSGRPQGLGTVVRSPGPGAAT